MFYQISFSPQVKLYAIITYKHSIYELSHELLNDLRLRNFRKLGNIRKVSKLHRANQLSGFSVIETFCVVVKELTGHFPKQLLFAREEKII